MGERGLLQGDDLSGISFEDSQIKVLCPNLEMLVQTFHFLRHRTQLLGFRTSFATRGFPFWPKQWVFKGLPAVSDEADLVTGLEEYLERNKEQLGQVRAVWARLYKVPGIQGKEFFAGNLLLLTDAATLRSSGPIEAFSGVEPKARGRYESAF